MIEKIENWIESWVLIYPEEAEFNGRQLRSKAKDCLSKMQKFVKDNPQYTKSIIFAATQMYVKEQASRNFEYTKQSNYFINKLGQPSLLEQYCDKVIKGTKPFIVEQPIEYNQINDFI